jgi:hypothetical protein
MELHPLVQLVAVAEIEQAPQEPAPTPLLHPADGVPPIIDTEELFDAALAQLALGLHLTHGAGSWLQSLGLARGWVRNLTLPLGYGIAAIIVVGNCSIPISILLGWVK